MYPQTNYKELTQTLPSQDLEALSGLIRRTPRLQKSEALLELNRHFFSPTEEVVMTHGKGIYLYDSKGQRYIDCASATFNLSLGYGHEEVLNAAMEQARHLVHATSSFMTEPVSMLTEQLIKIVPEGLNKVHLKVSSGSVANEGAIKMAQYHHKKSEVISLFYSHHGQTIYTMHASGNAFRTEPFQFAMPGILKVPAPFCHRCFYNQKPETCGLLCAERIEDFIEHASSNQVAAIIVEPILGSGDNIVPPNGYLQALRKLCNEHEIALIFDEIQTGIGRTGEFFAAQHFGVTPDLMTVAKGLGGSGFQVAAILCKEAYAQMDGMHHSFTYGSNPVAAAAGAKTLEIIQRPGFLENVRETGAYILERLCASQQRFRQLGDARGVGLMIGFEIVDEDGNPNLNLMKRVQRQALENGLILRSSRYGRGNVLKIRPPLIITKTQSEELCDLLDETFAQTLR
jgi:4-aminobutyrate aminotransferase-like enzyme